MTKKFRPESIENLAKEFIGLVMARAIVDIDTGLHEGLRFPYGWDEEGRLHVGATIYSPIGPKAETIQSNFQRVEDYELRLFITINALKRIKTIVNSAKVNKIIDETLKQVEDAD